MRQGQLFLYILKSVPVIYIYMDIYVSIAAVPDHTTYLFLVLQGYCHLDVFWV